MGAMIVLANVTKRYPAGIVALEAVSFTVEEGEFFFITGPSGAGKTTIIRLLLGQERPTEGQILVAKRNVRALRDSAIPYLRRNLGVVFQDFRLMETRTVFENVAVTLQVLGLTGRQVRQRVEQVLEILGLTHVAGHYPPMLSGGEQQRVAVARALVNDPPLILADEPTGNLDPAMALEVMDLLTEAHRKGATVLVATHDPDLLSSYRARCLQLQRGRVVAETVTGNE